MNDTNRRLGTPIAVISACAVLFLGLIALAVFGPNEAPNPALGFPIVLGVLAVVAVLGAVAWRSMSRRKSDRR
jgi:membrane protein implicated in regulation of membrane protease activity